MPASVFDAVSVVMSGAPAFSPVESWYEVLFAAGAESAPEAIVGRATAATAIARASQGRVSGRTSASG
jgi:heterodisulfide reductase subunit A-like polyferredoxin